MTNQEELQVLKAKQAHLRDSIAQLRKELEEELSELAEINLELYPLNLSEGNK